MSAPIHQDIKNIQVYNEHGPVKNDNIF